MCVIGQGSLTRSGIYWNVIQAQRVTESSMAFSAMRAVTTGSALIKQTGAGTVIKDHELAMSLGHM